MFRVLLLAIGVIIAVSLLPVQATQPSAFADPAFAALYNTSNAQQRALLWGSDPLVSLIEPFTGAPGDRRLVQYFDRGRMEMATLGTDERDVTQGLLVREMATGNVQVGYDTFVQGAPAVVPVFSSARAEPDQMLLTYADFANVVHLRAGDRTSGEQRLVDEWIEPGGTVTEQAAPATVMMTIYEEESDHNIPDVFASWFETEPFGSITRREALGLPITEAYWVYSGRGTNGISLIQMYERRVVVYTPDLPEAERYSLTNSGRHYYRWRYGNNALNETTSQARSVRPATQSDAGLTLPQGYTATVLRRDMPELFGMAVAPDGRVALGNPDGTVTFIDPRNPDVRSPFPAVEFLANAVDLTYAGGTLYVVDDAGLHRYIDIDADGRVEAIEDIDTAAFVRESVALAPGPDGSLFYCGLPVNDSATATTTAEASGARTLLTIGAGETSPSAVSLEIDANGPLVVDEDGVIWVINDTGQLIQVQPGTRDTVMLETDVARNNSAPTVVKMLLYRSDGASGDPMTDLIAIVASESGTGGRIVRLHPAQANLSAGTSAPLVSQPGAIVDFITGFDRPTLMATGLDGSLYIYDAGRGALYWIRPA